jgi:hypothetical protein
VSSRRGGHRSRARRFERDPAAGAGTIASVSRNPWLALAPFTAVGVLVGHALAYRLTGTPTGPTHDYLEHAPQVLALLMVVAAGLTAFAGRHPRRAPWQFALAAPLVFVLQEHLERLVHTGHIPLLLTSPTFLVGLVLQVPLALVVTAVARRLLEAVAAPLWRSRPRVRALSVPVALPAPLDLSPSSRRPFAARAPPAPAAS